MRSRVPFRRGVTSSWIAGGSLAFALLVTCRNAHTQSGTPTAPPPDRMTVMLDASWWLRIQRDGHHALGFGALPVQIPVAPDAFEAVELLRAVSAGAFVGAPDPGTPDECRYGVTFHPSAEPGLVHTVPTTLCDALAQAFRAAWSHRQGDVPPAFEVVERAWRDAPFQVR